MKGMRTITRPTRRQLGARLPRVLYDKLKERASSSGKSYPAILADAYIAHSEKVAATSASNGNHPFEYQPPTRVIDGKLVQFYLNNSQIELLKSLAAEVGDSTAGVIRSLLEKHLESSSQNGVIFQNGVLENPVSIPIDSTAGGLKEAVRRSLEEAVTRPRPFV